MTLPRRAPTGTVVVIVLAIAAGLSTSAPARVPLDMTVRVVGRPPVVVYGYPYAGRCPGAGLVEVVDRWQMFMCNCTSYVAWALTANQQRTDWFVPGAMDAWNWPNVARRAGLVVDSVPARGVVAVWRRVARPFGHVAYVTRVHANGAIDVAEYNFPLLGSDTFIFGARQGISTAGAVFIHVPRVVSRQPAAARFS